MTDPVSHSTRRTLKSIVLALIDEIARGSPIAVLPPENCGLVRYVLTAPFGAVVTDRGCWLLDENGRWVTVPAYEMKVEAPDAPGS